MYGAPIQTQRFGGGFSASRFQSMSRREPQSGAPMGAVIRPAVIPIGPVGPIVSPAPFVYPPAVISPPGVYFTDSSADDKKVVGIIVALALLGLGAALL